MLAETNPQEVMDLGPVAHLAAIEGRVPFINFSLVDSMYLTKSVRRGFVIKKYIINGALCGELKRYLAANAPQYRYKCLMNIAEAVK